MPTDAANANLSPAEHVRIARSAFVRDTLKSERWSIRQAALALGMSHTALASRLRSETLFLADEIENIAHLLRVEPVAYYGAYLAAGTTKAPTPEGEGLKLPGLDSNQEPIGFKPDAEILPFATPSAHRQGDPREPRRLNRPVVTLANWQAAHAS